MNRLNCHILDNAPSEGMHTHAFAQIILPLKKPLTLRCEGLEYRISPEQLGFVPPDTLHGCVCSDMTVTINIPLSMIQERDMEILESRTVIAIEGPFVPLVALIKSEIARDANSDSIRYLYYYLYDKLIEANGIKSLRYMRDHFSERLNVAKLAKLENYNISYFNSWFKRQTGYTPSDYLRHIRLEKAKELLLATRYSLLDIALQVGYSSNSSFARAFRESEGVSPNQWRDLAKGE